MKHEGEVSLTIDLQEGFADDLIIVRVNGREVCRREGVKTRLMLGYADSFKVQIPEGSVNVEVILPLKNLSETIVLQASKEIYLGLSILDGRIHHRISHVPFGYL